jgi:two-component system, NarL family, response regulator DegU
MCKGKQSIKHVTFTNFCIRLVFVCFLEWRLLRINIYLIHPFQILRAGITLTIKKEFESSSIQEFNTLKECDTSLLNRNDILVLHIQSTTTSILHSIEKLHNKGIKIVCWLESIEDEIKIRSLFKKGYEGYFVGEVETVEFLECLHHLVDNFPYLHSKLSSLLLKEYQSVFTNSEKNESVRTEAKGELYSLTNREWEVLVYMSKGYNNINIAQKLVLTESTVKNHVSAILRKLNVIDRTAAVVLAFKNKWVKY